MPRLSLFLRIAMAAATVAALAANRTAAAETPPFGAWQARKLLDHPLVGRIWQPEMARFETRKALLDAARSARFVLIGEIHDNPDHHRIEAWLARSLIAGGRRIGIAFEMFPRDRQQAIDRYRRHHQGAAGLGPAAGWDEGWPDWSQYAPIAAPALAAGLPVIAADMSGRMVTAILSRGFTALPNDLAARLGLDREMPAPIGTALARDIADAHCGAIPPPKALPFAQVQFARDAFLAEGLLRADTGQGAMLISGASHARTDRGVPWHLRPHGVPDRDILSIAAVEVVPGAATPADYAQSFGADRLPFDYVWFTPRAERHDPCLAFRKNAKQITR